MTPSTQQRQPEPTNDNDELLDPYYDEDDDYEEHMKMECRQGRFV